VPLHIHENEDEMFHVLEGSIEFTANGQQTVAGPGTTVFLPRNQPHAFKAVAATESRTMVTTYPAGLEHMFDELGALPPGPPDMEAVVAICAKFGVRFQ
jgi:quercetin dioxygenase-like cupin family protein